MAFPFSIPSEYFFRGEEKPILPLDAKSFFWGEGNPLISAVDARKAPASPNGHGLRPPSVAAGAQGAFPSPQGPPSFPQRVFSEGTQACGKYLSRGICSFFIFYLFEINRKISVNRRWSIFSLKYFIFQTIRPVVSWKKRGFSAHFGPGDAVPPLRVAPFSKVKRSNLFWGVSVTHTH